MRTRLARTLTFAVAGGLFTSMALGADPLTLPDWSAIFTPDGQVLDLKGGLEAVFLQDKVSDGLGVDMSVIVEAGHAIVGNGVVPAAGDLGNGYVYATRDGAGNLILYGGVERLDSPGDTYVEFEFNQDVVKVNSGVPWPIYGTRTPGDILVRLSFAGGVMTRGEFGVWDGTAFQIVSSSETAEMPCGGVTGLHVFCTGPPPMETVSDEVWDSAGTPVETRPPDSFVEFGVDVAGLVGSNVELTSILVRTPRDVILDSFRTFGHWAQLPEAGGTDD